MKTLLSVIIGIACGFAVNQILIIKIDFFMKACYALVYLSFVTRFFEGNIIFYCKTYKSETTGEVDYLKGRIDFYFIFFQFFVFTAMGKFIGKLSLFLISIFIINVLDVIWNAFHIYKYECKDKTSLYWCLSNLVFALIILISYLALGKALYTTYASEALVFLTLISILAAIFDYWFNRKFYFGNEAKECFVNF